ncbi:MAG: hypothetical protein VR64_21340 [Desulfatitalea sp. BRH_c12]|nr:MAG: hypothetical protein VR64_21340 [Desulfatitalea sp. BRH_c12]
MSCIDVNIALGERMNKVELTRMQYRPSILRILFVGESAPAKGSFFYDGGCNFTRHTRSAFEIVRGRSFASDGEFLSVFRDRGCWLDDISHTPIDLLNRRERKEAIQKSIPNFAGRLTEASPEVVIVMLRRIKEQVSAAVQASGIQARIEYLPFPGFGHQRKFIELLVPVLRETL